MFLHVLALALLSLVSARPNTNFVPQNVVSVPPNCPEGQEYINGQCRDVWRIAPTPAPARFEEWIPQNMVTVPTNCPTGQQLINGQCRDVWKGIVVNKALLKAIRANFEISPFARLKRQEDFGDFQPMDIPVVDQIDRGIISVPNQCPGGYKPDALGICRPIFG